jgi:hypothetical protein
MYCSRQSEDREQGKGREGKEEGRKKTDLDFALKSLQLSHVANQLIVDRWHLKRQILGWKAVVRQLEEKEEEGEPRLEWVGDVLQELLCHQRW